MARGGGVLLAALVVLAGCGGLAGSTQPTRTLTPVALPTDEPTPTPVEELAPGLTAAGVASPFRIADAHAGLLGDASFTLRSVRTVRTANGSLRARTTLTGAFAPGRRRYHVVLTRDGRDARFDRLEDFSDGRRVLRAIERNNSTSYTVVRGPGGEPAHPREVLFVDPIFPSYVERLLEAIEAARVESVGGGPARTYRVRATAVSKPTVAAAVEAGAVENVSLTLLVDERGLVYELRLEYATELLDTPVRVTRRFRYSAVGATTVDRPPWYAAAVNATR